MGVNPNPVMPLITDSERQLDRLGESRARAGARSFGGGPLFLMPCAQKVFFPFLEAHFPELAAAIPRAIRNSAYLGQAYKDMLRRASNASATATAWIPSMIEYRPELWRARSRGSSFRYSEVDSMNLADFDFHLPEELIAQEPSPTAPPRACWCSTAPRPLGRPPVPRIPRSCIRAIAWS